MDAVLTIAPPLRTHDRQHGLGRLHHRCQADLNGIVPHRLVGVSDAGKATVAQFWRHAERVVVQHVNPAMAAHGLRDHRIDVGGIGHICDNRRGDAARTGDLAGHGFGAVVIDIGYYHPGSALCETEGGGAADS